MGAVVFRTASLSSLLADHVAEHGWPGVWAYRSSDGWEVLRIGERVFAGLTSGEVIEIDRATLDRMLAESAARAEVALAARAARHPRGLSGLLADDAAAVAS